MIRGSGRRPRQSNDAAPTTSATQGRLDAITSISFDLDDRDAPTSDAGDVHVLRNQSIGDLRDSHDKHARFCTVCRYVLVEQIDPVQHALVDRHYAKHFPL